MNNFEIGKYIQQANDFKAFILILKNISNFIMKGWKDIIMGKSSNGSTFFWME